MVYILIIISAVFVNNIVLTQFLGICPFLGVSNKVSTATGMGLAVIFVMTLATLFTFLAQKYLLDPLGIGFMQTVAFILIIAALVQMVEIILKKISPSLYQALGIFLPLITTNCAVLGVAIKVTQEISIGGQSMLFTLPQALVYAASMAAGFALALILFAGLREQMELQDTPKAFEGTPIALITAGILAMAFMGFSGIV